MATRPTTLCSLATVKDYLKVTVADQDATLERLADRASELIEQQTGVLFVTREISETYGGDGSSWLYLRQHPVTGVSLLTVVDVEDGSPITIDPADYQVDLERGVIRLRRSATPHVFPVLFNNISVTYTAGYGAQDAATLPADVYGAGLDLVAYLWSEKQAGATAASSVNIGPGNIFIKPDLPVHIRETVRAWTRRYIA